jgi:hypothetical protein
MVIFVLGMGGKGSEGGEETGLPGRLRLLPMILGLGTGSAHMEMESLRIDRVCD